LPKQGKQVWHELTVLAVFLLCLRMPDSIHSFKGNMAETIVFLHDSEASESESDKFLPLFFFSRAGPSPYPCGWPDARQPQADWLPVFLELSGTAFPLSPLDPTQTTWSWTSQGPGGSLFGFEMNSADYHREETPEAYDSYDGTSRTGAQKAGSEVVASDLANLIRDLKLFDSRCKRVTQNHAQGNSFCLTCQPRTMRAPYLDICW
jgi:hypothetical protein